MDFLQALQEVWAIRALIASGMVGIMCGALGAFIVLRNMSLIGDALSHAILPGVVLAFIILGYSALGFFAGAVVAGLLAALAITWIQRNVHTKNDAAIGIVFTAMFAIGVMGISWVSQNQGVHLDLKDFLFGNVLGMKDQDLILTTSITCFVVLSIIVFYRYLFISTFQPVIAETMGISVNLIHYFLMLILSFAVVASLQTVGVILVVAMLITPASTALLLSSNLKWVVALSALLGLLSAVTGLIVSIEWETTPGPAMAVVTAVFYLFAAFFAPHKGMIAKWIAKRRQQRKIEKEDILKESLKLSLNKKLSTESLLNRLSMPGSRLRRHLKKLQNEDLVDFAEGVISLKVKGKERAYQLIRAHRLWETYLANQVGLAETQIHEDAEQIEHFLTDELIDEVDRELGYPKVDPHGSPIPEKSIQSELSMYDLAPGQKALISGEQKTEHITHMLWKQGLIPGQQIKVVSKTEELVIVMANEKEIEFQAGVASRILVRHFKIVPGMAGKVNQ